MKGGTFFSKNCHTYSIFVNFSDDFSYSVFTSLKFKFAIFACLTLPQLSWTVRHYKVRRSSFITMEIISKRDQDLIMHCLVFIKFMV